MKGITLSNSRTNLVPNLNEYSLPLIFNFNVFHPPKIKKRASKPSYAPVEVAFTVSLNVY